MKTAIYVRVSTDDKGQDPRNQLRQLRDFARKQERWTVVQEYIDRATGRNGDRKQFRAMMQDASRRKFDVLLFWDLSRLTREGVFQTLCYLRQLTDAGVKYKSYQQPFLDTTGIWGECLTAVFAALAQEESRLLGERVKAGMARAAAAGTHCGRPRRQVDVARARRLRAKGLTISAIAKRMKLSRAVVWERLAA